jgi:hypothetical protein
MRNATAERLLMDAEESLKELRAYINLWKEDRRCGLLPTDDSLNRAAVSAMEGIASLGVLKDTISTLEAKP